MTELEMNIAIHTDSKYADILRSKYSESTDFTFSRAEFLGSRVSFEGLWKCRSEGKGDIYQLKLTC